MAKATALIAPKSKLKLKLALAAGPPLVIAFFIFLIFTLLFGLIFAPDASGTTPDPGTCSANGAYVPLKDGEPGPNLTIIDVAYAVATTKQVSDRVMLALFEAGTAESHFKNYANDGHHGPEDDKGTPSTPEQLAAAGTSMDKHGQIDEGWVGTDHASVGFLQQQVGPGFSWGTVDQALDPAHATQAFLTRALANEISVTGTAGDLAQSVQHSAPDKYNSVQTEAQGYLDGAKARAAAGGGTPSVPLAGTPVGGAPAAPTGGVDCSGGTGTFTPGETKTVVSKGLTFHIVIPTGRRGEAMAAALSKLGLAYVYGGSSPDQFDCSGLMQWSWGQAGVTLQRTSESQFASLPATTKPIPGDLAFPLRSMGDDGIAGQPGHVGMYAVDDKGVPLIIEAPHTGDVLKVITLSDFGTSVYASPISGS